MSDIDNTTARLKALAATFAAATPILAQAGKEERAFEHEHFDEACDNVRKVVKEKPKSGVIMLVAQRDELGRLEACMVATTNVTAEESLAILALGNREQMSEFQNDRRESF